MYFYMLDENIFDSCHGNKLESNGKIRICMYTTGEETR